MMTKFMSIVRFHAQFGKFDNKERMIPALVWESKG